ncbi:MAG: carbamoyltransferase C-terminal domain-containing protein [Candidatus Omnitrophota bacterium]
MKKINDLMLGISTTHNGGACLLDADGNILISLSEERLSRCKNELGVPHKSIDYILSQVNPEKIKYVAVGSSYFGMSEKQLPVFLFNSREKNRVFKNPFLLLKYFSWGLKRNLNTVSDGFKKDLFLREFKKHNLNIEADNIFFVDHHLAHAAGAFYTCALDDALVLTIDSFGDDKSASVNVGKGNTIALKYPVSSAESIGYMYTFITTALGFVSGRHEGKVTGLAAYGNPEVIGKKLGEYVFVEKDADNLTFRNRLLSHRAKVSLRYMHRWAFEYVKWFFSGRDFEVLTRKVNKLMSELTFKKLFGEGHSQEDVSAGAQFVLEDCVCKIAEFYLKKYNCKNLVLSGGVFANVKLNQRLFNLPEVENIYVHPGMSDEGLALGAACKILFEHNPDIKRKNIQDVYFGPSFAELETEDVLKKYGLKYTKVEDDKILAKDTASWIAQGKIIGLFKGRMEYGPRALGARSVLADPRKKETHNILNQRMKRSEFMPFAPVIPYERAKDILDGKIDGSEHAAEFMTITYDIKKEWQGKIPAVVHVDGTARPQLIKRETNPLYYDIVTEFGKITGIPVIVNTSFNMHEEPIVCTPEDAVRSYLQGCVDIMIIDNFLIGEK